MKTRLLVIGYGNELRRDDGVGPRVARIVASWGRPGLRALAVHQLTPELAELLAESECVVFVDASVLADDAVCMRMVESAGPPTPVGHLGDPRALLALTLSLYDRRPAAWLLTIPAADLGFGRELSPRAEHGLEAALEKLASLADHWTANESQSCMKPA